MKGKSIIFFILALAASFLAATYRWGDSAHSIGLIKASGGEARHPAYLQSGESRLRADRHGDGHLPVPGRRTGRTRRQAPYRSPDLPVGTHRGSRHTPKSRTQGQCHPRPSAEGPDRPVGGDETARDRPGMRHAIRGGVSHGLSRRQRILLLLRGMRRGLQG